jgi:hypothetical protein
MALEDESVFGKVLRTDHVVLTRAVVGGDVSLKPG